nr:CPBP family intramembrane glutamic endopeptidase [uncultured Actinoplanes sp.]
MSLLVAPVPTGKREPRVLVTFTAIALPVGWVLLSVPLVTDLPLGPFVLGTQYLGMVLPAVLMTGRPFKRLLVDTVRLPRPLWLLLPAVLLIPAAVLAGGALTGGAIPPTLSIVTNVVSSVLIVNLWEEMIWAGFVQRRAMSRWGYVRGSALTALLFIGIHLPLSLYGARSAADVVRNIAFMIVSGLGLRLLIGAFDAWSHGSILALAFLHATFNASSGLVVQDLVRYAVTLALGIAAAAVVVRRIRSER